ncbi:MAG: hypothetical protein GY721_07750, partial [Deltaproteobacteria bacterium]|nr:hypothetical protein [Deltaproteobacteria bacterium]
MSDFYSMEEIDLSDSADEERDEQTPLVEVEEQEEGNIVISYIFPGFSANDSEQDVDGETMAFKEVGITGAGFVSESGKPLLPSFGRYVQIPPGYDYDISIEHGDPMEIEGILVTPAQEDATDKAGAKDTLEFDKDQYDSSDFYPENIVEVDDPQCLDSYKVVLVHIRPLRYSAAKKLLQGFGKITVTISLKPAEEADDEEFDVYPEGDPASTTEAAGNLILNPRRRIFRRMHRLKPPRIRGPIAIRPKGEEFLIIYADELRVPAEKLACWKNQRGLVTETVCIDTVGNSVGKIKDYIRRKRKKFLSRLRYVLLFGDVDCIVTDEVGGVTTDHYYYTNKDATGNSDCRLPWVSGGRIPVCTTADGNDVVSQVIAYEKNPPADPEYYTNMSFSAYFQDDGPQDGKANRAYMTTMESIRSHMIGLGFNVDRIYVSNNDSPEKYRDGTLVPQDVKNAIVDDATATDMLIEDTTEGRLMIGHRDHGSNSGWAEPSFKKQHLSSINSQVPSIFYSINCSTGKFDSGSGSFAEAMLKMKGGAPSLVAATENSGTWRNDSLIKGLFDALWPGVISTYPSLTAGYSVKNNRLGDILNYAKAYLPVKHGSNSGVK